MLQELDAIPYLCPMATTTPKAKLITENIKDVFTLRKCWHWLELHYGNPNGEEWSPKQVERCYTVLLTLLERQTGGDQVIYHQPNDFGLLYGTRKNIINRMFRQSDMTVCSSDHTAEKPVSIVKIIKDDLE
jgi:hypothetical protein